MVVLMYAVQDLINTVLFFQMLCNASIKPTQLKKKNRDGIALGFSG